MMRLSRPAAVFAAVVIVASGAVAVSAAATQTSPVTLCANSKTAALTLPSSSGTCAKGSTEFIVASNADVEAVAGRLDAAEGTVTSQGTRISTLEGQVSALQNAVEALEPARLTVDAGFINEHQFYARINGKSLKPGTDVIWHFTADSPDSYVAAQVQSGGTVFHTFFSLCQHTYMYATATAVNGDTITSNVTAKGPGCP